MVHNENYSQQRDLISGISQNFLACKYKLVYSTQLQIMVLLLYLLVYVKMLIYAHFFPT